MPACALAMLVIACGGCGVTRLGTASAWAETPPAWAPAEAQPIMGIDEVKVGMKGYGLSVFHGDDIEAFPVVAVSVVTHSDPNRAVIWVSCTDERMQRTGPVQGMSGSPIYLWDEGEEQVLGQGGRLIGAFAFGYADTNECLAGVQPIGYMRQTGERATMDDVEARRAALRARPGAVAEMMAGLTEQWQADRSPWKTETLGLASELLGRTPWGPNLEAVQDQTNAAAARESVAGESLRMALPVNVGSAEAARVLAPMIRASGLTPYAGGGSAGLMSVDGLLSSDALLPSNVEAERVILEPGSVLAVPLAFGDYVPAAAGTVTDVLPDGTVLGFGHAMEGVGDTALPMATGYTHYVVSRRSISFKWTGVLSLQGTLLQDENAAVAGLPGSGFTTSPMTVGVSMPEQPDRSYDYEIVNHPTYTPSISVLMPIVSMLAVQTPPMENMLRVRGTYEFDQGRRLPIDTVIPFGSPQAFAFEVAPVVSTLMMNGFEKIELVDSKFDLDIVEGVELAFVESVSVTPTVADPGDTVIVRVVSRAYEGPAQTHVTAFTVPLDAAGTELPIIAAGADDFMWYELMSDPKYATIESLDELFEAYTKLLNPQRESLHVALVQPQRASTGTTVGNATLHQLPSHVAAMLQNPGGTGSLEPSPFVPEFVHRLPVGQVVAGEQIAYLQVRDTDE